jgi:hypothetical protein
LIFVDLIFLALGALLYIYSDAFSIMIPSDADMLFPNIALNSGLPAYVGILFIIGIIAAAYSSADSALTALTTSFCVDILEFEKQDPQKQIKTRKYVHLLMSLVLLGVILIFNAINDQSVIKSLFTVAGYTYGPLLGMFSFGIFTKFKVKDKFVPLIAIASPVICYILNLYIPFGFELLILNGLITFVGLYLLKIKKDKTEKGLSILLFIGLTSLVSGFILMGAGGPEDTTQFSNEVFSATHLTIAPILLAGGFFLCWIALSIGCGTYARNRGRSFLGFFIFSFLISPLIGFVVAFISVGNSEINKCPDCSEFIKLEANVCKHCGKRFDLKMER